MSIFNWDVYLGDLVTPVYAEHVLETRPKLTKAFRWPTELPTIPEMGSEVQRCVDERGSTVVRLSSDVGVEGVVRLWDGQITGQVSGDEEAAVYAYVDYVRETIPATSSKDGQVKVPVTFWSLGSHGPSSRSRKLDVIRWQSSSDNYPDEHAGVALARLLTGGFRPGEGGQLLVWSGPPGTGKTNALRALAWEWRGWCDLHYITDPEVFWGDRAAYMLDVLLDDDRDDEELDSAEKHPLAADGRWRLLVLEDTGEMLARDAKDRTGQGLSRLLNVVDGLIGQGLRVLVLVTTNENTGSLHDAIQRPGRCASKLTFGNFSIAGAREWLVERGMTEGAARDAVDRPVPLSDLYALVAGREPSAEREPQRAGFA